jgi:hypothetical protein
MQVTRSRPISKSDNLIEQSYGVAKQGGGTAPERVGKASDEIVITDLARINLLTQPRDGAQLARLQQAVFSGEYGPPAATIAERLISSAIARGLKV